MLEKFNKILKTGLSSNTNYAISDVQWIQASLPAIDGGLGIRSVMQLALPSFLASVLVLLAFGRTFYTTETWAHIFSSPTTARSGHLLPIPEPPASQKQCSWDRPGIELDEAAVWKSSAEPALKRRLPAVSTPHSGDWLHAVPVASCGLELDGVAIRIAVGLQLALTFASLIDADVARWFMRRLISPELATLCIDHLLFDLLQFNTLRPS